MTGMRNTQHRVRPRTSGFSITQVLVVLAILAITAALLLPAVRTARGPARRAQCRNNLKQIAFALHNYESDYGVLPPACTVDADGNPLHSWRTLILPYVDQEALYHTIDLTKPWDHETNSSTRNTRVSAYRCMAHEVEDQSAATYLAVVTPDSCIASTEGRAFSDVSADHAETLLVVEVGPQHAIPWMAPQDVDESLLETLRSEDAQPHPGGLNVAYVDGSVRFLSIETSQDEWLRLISITKRTKSDD